MNNKFLFLYYFNGLFHGKGTMYYSNGKIKYEGDWINNKFVED